MVIDIVNSNLIIAQEYCTDIACDATMLETIPVGCISKIVMLKPGKEIKGEMYSVI
jgi:hypothetical protein